MHQLSAALRHYISPILLPLVALIGTIGTRYYYASIIPILIFILPINLIIAIVATKREQLKYVATILIISILLGWTQTNRLINHYNQFPFEKTATPCVLKGIVTSKSYNPTSHMKYSLSLSLQSINGILQPAYTIQLFMFKAPLVAVGDTLSITDVTIKKVSNSDFRRYLMKEGFAASTFLIKPKIQIENHPAFSLYRTIDQLRSSLFATFKKKLTRPAFALFSSLFLGERASSKYTLDKVQQQCKSWGILHYLARSGLHLVMVFSAYELMLRFVPLPYLIKQLIMLILGIIYHLLSWPTISFIRAFLVFIFYKTCIFFFRPIHVVHIVLLTCFTILLINPFQLFFLDFQLSFLLTFALGWLNLGAGIVKL